MRLLIVGIGALGGIIGARLLARGISVGLAARDVSSAAALRAAGLHVTGIGGEIAAHAPDVRAIADWPRASFDLIVLATKADDALAIAPRCVELLASGGTLLPIQNGAVAQVLARKHPGVVLGGLSNLGATMHAPGRYEQRNAGHILIGELGGGVSERAAQVASVLGAGIDMRTTPNMSGAIWSKLLLNCTVTTLGAVAGTTMRGYIGHPDGRVLFDRAYDETLSVAKASGVRPERMLVDPIPPADRGPWIEQILAAYGDLRPSMHQDFERRRPTEIEFINGYVAKLGPELGTPAPLNAAIADVVRAISKGAAEPRLENLGRILHG